MARRRFFVPGIRRGGAELTGREAEHLVRVLRAEPGQIHEISDNRDLYLAEIDVARKSLVSFRVLEKLDTPAPAVQVCLLAALIKFERFEWLIEKATELGVSAIQPIETIRTEKGLAKAAHQRRSRWEKIALEASQQSRRAHLPRVELPFRLERCTQIDASVRLMLDESSGAPPILGCLPQERKASDHVALLLGPEGGWTDQEREWASGEGWTGCSLGPNVLRTETAGLAALAVIQAAWAPQRPEPDAPPPEQP
ncbi:MAG: 16S rRNA (uracil(1498)-N(3))-methyltransferase [Acidobacteriaceae bacterium]|nr:16S rRNA (uracil(1498)-N(3))-methyltransferase [Acidobacteriaceae bacterium]